MPNELNTNAVQNFARNSVLRARVHGPWRGASFGDRTSWCSGCVVYVQRGVACGWVSDEATDG